MKPPNHGRLVRDSDRFGGWWVGYLVLTPARVWIRWGYGKPFNLGLLVIAASNGGNSDSIVPIFDDDRIELLP